MDNRGTVIKNSDKEGTIYRLKDGRNSTIILELAMDRYYDSFVCLAEADCIFVMRDEEYKIPFELACELYDLPEYRSDIPIIIYDYD